MLDYVSRDDKAERERDKLAMRTIALADMIGEGKINPAMKEQELQKLERECGIDITRGLPDVELRRELYGVVEHIFSRFTDDESDMLSQLFPFGMKETRFRFPKECYAQAIELPYENIRIPAPIQYCKMLKDKYGDYMKLVRNAGGHDYPFFEAQKKQLQAVLDFDELYRQADISEQYFAHVQQLVIDMGTLIERVKGEGTKTVNRLEQLCEDIYQLSVGDGNIDIIADIKEAKGAFELEIQNNKETVFIVSKAEQWKYAQWYYLKN